MRTGFLLAGYYGFGNLGDELLCSSVAALLEKHFPGETVTVATADGLPNGPRPAVNRWNPLVLFGVLRRCRWLVLGGGGLLQNKTSAKSLIYYVGLILLARLAGAKVAALGQSLGPLEGRWARCIAAFALRRCCLVSVRDDPSEELAACLGIGVRRSPDFVSVLSPNEGVKERALLLNLRPSRRGGAEELAVSAAARAEKESKRLIFLAFSREDLECLHALQGKGILTVDEEHLLTVSNWRDLFCSGDEVMGMRLHCAVLAWLSGLPTAMLAYDPKVAGFVNQKGGKLWTADSPDPGLWTVRDNQSDLLAALMEELES